ncbi:MAG: acyl-CoA dehydrogenase family protein [Beijerinckiaceae bacterium]|nr:acyl-CoA dehydrogenase family protein [Beijerinckiaceae bacterium]
MKGCDRTDGGARAGTIAWLRDYGAKRLNSLLIDTRRCIPPYIVLDFGNAGLLGLQAPTEMGGLALSNLDAVAVLAQLAAIDLNLAAFTVVHNCLGVGPVMRAAREPTRSEILAELASGRKLGAFALTEPVAGSNPNGLQGTAVLGPDGRLKLNATKMWIGSAGWSSYINVFARYIGGPGGSQGTSAHIVPVGTPGLRIGPELLTMGMRGMVQNVVHFEDVALEERYQLGTQGEGMAVAKDAMMLTRLALGAAFLGAMKRCLQLMTRYTERRTGICAGRLVDNPVTRVRTCTILAQTIVLEQLVTFAASALDRQIDVPEELLIVAKAAGSEFLWQASDWALQALGGRGYLESNIITQIMRDARVGRIFEGPTETLLHHIGSRLMLSEGTLLDFLARQLDAADIAAKLVAARDAMKTRCVGLSESYPGRQARDYGNFVLGAIVSKGILHAAGRHAGRKETPSWSARWAARIFEEAVTKVDEDIDEWALPANDLLSRVNGLTTDIGDVEQSMPGEEWRLDPYLRVDANAIDNFVW